MRSKGEFGEREGVVVDTNAGYSASEIKEVMNIMV
jgi:hypothetical protein